MPVKEKQKHRKSLIISAFVVLYLYPRWESNPNLRFRKQGQPVMRVQSYG